MDLVRAVLIAAASVAVAAPAAAQLTQFELDNLRAQQEAAQRRSVDQANQLSALETRQRADQAILDLQLQQRLPQVIPELRYPAPASPGVKAAAPAKYPQIPDAALADSNQRVQAAAQNRR